MNIPVFEWFNVQAAVRFEDFGGDIGTTVDPKVALLFRPTEWLSVRGTYSTSFRAPTVFQTFGESTTLNNVVDPGPDGIIGTEDDGGTAFAAVRAFGSDFTGIPLSPETSRAFTAGFTIQPFEAIGFSLLDSFTFDFDFYDFSFEDAITQVAFQALVNANPIDTRTFVGGLATEPCEAEFTIICRAGDPETGTITQVNTSFANAESVDTSGIDFSLSFTYDAGRWGTFRPSYEGTFVFDYDIVDPANPGVVINGAGNRNFTNFGAPTPELRWNAGLTYLNGPFTYNFFARHIGGLDDDQNPGAFVESQTRFDMQWGLDVTDWIGVSQSTVLTLGIINITNEAPPFVNTNGGFESRVSDPRGRLIRFGLDVAF